MRLRAPFRVRTRDAAIKKRPTGVDRFLFYGGPSGVQPASQAAALGVGFPECIEDGYDMSKEELLEHGVNVSSTHVDFMIGTDDIDIVGITPDGREVVIFQNGQWSWE